MRQARGVKACSNTSGCNRESPDELILTRIPSFGVGSTGFIASVVMANGGTFYGLMGRAKKKGLELRAVLDALHIATNR